MTQTHSKKKKKKKLNKENNSRDYYCKNKNKL